MADFQALYTSLRNKEGRNYSDNEIKALPSIPKSHKYYKEWCIREKSAKRIANYLNHIKHKQIIEIGCGIGWFSNYLATNTKSNVLGIDIHEGELELASRNFNAPNPTFKVHNIIASDLPFKADCIVMNGTIQYFNDLDLLFNRIAKNLSYGGEVHIVDSPIHISKASAEQAKNRTEDYYERLGVSELKKYFNHHCVLDLPRHQILYSYGVLQKIQNKLGAFNSPFPWIKLDATELCF